MKEKVPSQDRVSGTRGEELCKEKQESGWKQEESSYDKLPLNYEKKWVRNYDNCCDFTATKKVRILLPEGK